MNQNSSRRKFIKTSAIAGIASTAIVGNLFGQTKQKKQYIKPDVNKLVFLFQGDSITDGNRGRNADPNHIMGHGYPFAVASRVGADFPNEGFTFHNRGISGNKITDLQKRWQTDTIDLKPDVLSILVGINDVNEYIKKPASLEQLEEFELNYRDILNQAKIKNPEILFVLGIPFVYEIGSRKENWAQWTEGTAQRAKIVNKLASEFNAVLVDYPTAFQNVMKGTKPEYWIWDGIHPTVFGHEIMAREWIKQVAERLTFLKFYNFK